MAIGWLCFYLFSAAAFVYPSDLPGDNYENAMLPKDAVLPTAGASPCAPIQAVETIFESNGKHHDEQRSVYLGMRYESAPPWVHARHATQGLATSGHPCTALVRQMVEEMFEYDTDGQSITRVPRLPSGGFVYTQIQGQRDTESCSAMSLAEIVEGATTDASWRVYEAYSDEMMLFAREQVAGGLSRSQVIAQEFRVIAEFATVTDPRLCIDMFKAPLSTCEFATVTDRRLGIDTSTRVLGSALRQQTKDRMTSIHNRYVTILDDEYLLGVMYLSLQMECMSRGFL
jgi:hypothetical protein